MSGVVVTSSSSMETTAAGIDPSSIKLPGGATLVAVSESNAGAIDGSKEIEKPHVTITIGDKVHHV